MREGMGAAEAAAEAADATEEAAADAAEAAATGGADAAALAAASGASAPGPVLAGEAPRVPMKTAPATKTTATAAPAIIRLRLLPAGWPADPLPEPAPGESLDAPATSSAEGWMSDKEAPGGKGSRRSAGGPATREGMRVMSSSCTATRAVAATGPAMVLSAEGASLSFFRRRRARSA